MTNSGNCFYSASSMHEVQRIIDEHIPMEIDPGNCWVLFDIDYTLIIPTLFFQDKQWPVTKESFFDVLIKYKDKQPIDRILSSVVFFQQTLLDEQSVQTLAEIAKTKRTFAFTACMNNEKNRNLRTMQLDQLGLNFRNAFEFSEVTLNDMPEYLGGHPEYENGILYSNGESAPYNKGDVLISFMKRIKTFPDHIVLIDDRKKNLQGVNDALKNTNCKFFGILYDDKQVREKIPTDILEKQISHILSIPLSDSTKCNSID